VLIAYKAYVPIACKAHMPTRHESILPIAQGTTKMFAPKNNRKYLTT
jgi:hypothetical protein